VYNYDRSGVYSNSTVGVAAYCFTDVILQDMDLSVLFVPLDAATLTEVFPNIFLGCKANSRV